MEIIVHPTFVNMRDYTANGFTIKCPNREDGGGKVITVMTFIVLVCIINPCPNHENNHERGNNNDPGILI
jgi:hypothetical protein